ncbi:MAG: hypothetical protein ABJC89_07350 [Acidobacteriota bacterium]
MKNAENSALDAPRDSRTTDVERVSAESARDESEQGRRAAEDARMIRNADLTALEQVWHERERLRETAEAARVAAEEERNAAERRREAAMDAVHATAETLEVTLDHMKVVEEMRRTLREIRDTNRLDSN